MEKHLKGIKAGELMSKFAITATEETEIPELAHLLMRFKISGVPISNDYGDVIGIVTATDLYDMFERIIHDIEKGYDPTEFINIQVKEIMTTDVITIDEQMTLFDIIKLMSSKNIHTLPVLGDNGEIKGVIGRRDVINACYAMPDKKK